MVNSKNPNKSLKHPVLSPDLQDSSQCVALPTVFSSNDTGMDNSTGQEPANISEVRGRTPTTAFNPSREFSMASSEWAMPYCDRMHDRMDCDSTSGDIAPELSYETELEKAFRTSKAADL